MPNSQWNKFIILNYLERHSRKHNPNACYNLFFIQLSSFRPLSSKEQLWHVTSLQPQPLKGFKLHHNENWGHSSFFHFCGFQLPTSLWGQLGLFRQKGPANWEATCATGKSQSPINLENQVFDKSLVLDPFSFENYQTLLVGAKLNNNGHTVQLNAPSNFVAQISGGGLNGTYQFAQLHFHWGDTKEQGSEHTMNGQAYPLEVHLVHFNTR